MRPLCLLCAAAAIAGLSPAASTPTLSFESGIGGGGYINYFLHPYLQTDFGSGIAQDAAGNIYLTGVAYSRDFPLVNPLPLTAVCSSAVCACPSPFVAKLSPDAKTILYSTLLTTCSEASPSIAADAAGNAYVAGTASAGQQFVQPGGTSIIVPTAGGFVVKLDSAGTLKAAVLLSGSSFSNAFSIALAPGNQLYVTGTDGTNVLLSKLDTALLNTALSVRLGQGYSPLVTTDTVGNAYVAASTTSIAWAVTPRALQPLCSGRTECADVVVSKLDPTGAVLYSTYLGGSGTDTLGSLAVDSSGGVYVTGTTDSSDFPTTAGAYIAKLDPYSVRAARTAFAAKISPDGTSLTWSTLLGDADGLTGTAIAVDALGNAWIGGSATATQLFTTANGFQPGLFNMICGNYTPSGSFPSNEGYCPEAPYVVELNSTGTSVVYATFLGGGNVSALHVPATPPVGTVSAILTDASGNLLITGNQLALRGTMPAPSITNSASIVKLTPGTQTLTFAGIQSAAGFGPGLPQPGGLAALYINGIPPGGTIVAPGLPLPFQLGGVTVLVDGIAAPVEAVVSLPYGTNRAQVNFQVPWEVQSTSPQPHVVEVQYGGQSVFAVPMQAAPGIFTLADGSGAIQHAADYSLVTGDNPVKRGENLIIYATGLGRVIAPVASGAPAITADPLANGCNQVSTNAGTVLYAGLTPGFPGLYQVNVKVADFLPSGTNYFYLRSTACWLTAPPAAVYQGNSVGVYVP